MNLIDIMKKTIRLTENDLKKIIRETVQHILTESVEYGADPNMTIRVVGGDLQGEYTYEEFEKIADIRGYVEPSSNPIYSGSKVVGYPRVVGYVGPMWDGDAIRYETQDVYNAMSF